MTSKSHGRRYLPIFELSAPGKTRQKCEEWGIYHIVRTIDEDENLVLATPAMHMSKPTHIRLDAVYEVSLRMLQRRNTPNRLSAASLVHARHEATDAIQNLKVQSYAHQRFPPIAEHLPCEIGAGFLSLDICKDLSLPIGMKLAPSREMFKQCRKRYDLHIEEGSLMGLKIPEADADDDLLCRTRAFKACVGCIVMRLVEMPGLSTAVVFPVIPTSIPVRGSSRV